MKIEVPDADGGNVISLCVIRENRQLRTLKSRCRHAKTTIDTTLAELTCDECGSKLNAIEWLAEFAEEYERFQRLRDQYIEARKAYDAKQCCKCEHCNKMTRWRT